MNELTKVIIEELQEAHEDALKTRDKQRERSNGSIASRSNIDHHDGRASGFREAIEITKTNSALAELRPNTIETFLRKADELLDTVELYNQFESELDEILKRFVTDRNATGSRKEGGWRNSYDRFLSWDPIFSSPGVLWFSCEDRGGDTIVVELPHEYVRNRDAWVAERLASMMEQAQWENDLWEASQIASKVLEAQERQDEAQNLLDRLTELTGQVYVPIEATR